MNSQPRNDSRDNRSRFPAQNSRREWVPRGSTAITTTSSTATVVNSLSSFNLHSNGNGGESNFNSPAPSKSQHSENLGRPFYQRGGKGKASGNHQKGKGLNGVNLG